MSQFTNGFSMQSHAPTLNTTSINALEASTNVYASQNQVSYNKFWAEHSKLSLYKSTKFLAHRDLLQLVQTHLLRPNPKTQYKILDYGCGAGETAQVVNDLMGSLGLETQLYCIDINQNNLAAAKIKNPQAYCHLLDKANSAELFDGSFDLIICNFVLLENLLPDVIKILTNLQHALGPKGIAIVTHNTAKVYDGNNDWVSFHTKFVENARTYYDPEAKKFTRHDGQAVKKSVFDHEGKVAFTFADYFYRRRTYKNAYLTTKLSLLASHKPLGNVQDPVQWKSEEKIPPYRIDILARVDGSALKENPHARMPTC